MLMSKARMFMHLMVEKPARNMYVKWYNDHDRVELTNLKYIFCSFLHCNFHLLKAKLIEVA